MKITIDENFEKEDYPKLLKVKASESGAGSIWLFSADGSATCLYGVNGDTVGDYQENLITGCFEICNNSVTLRN